MARGVEGLDVLGHYVGYVAQGGEGDIGDGYIGSESGGHEGGVAAYYAGAENEHFGGFYPGYASQQYAAAALRLLKEAAAFLYRHAAGYLAHGDEQRQGTVGESHCLVGDAHGA